MTGRDRGAALLMAVVLSQVLISVAMGGIVVGALVVERARIASVADLAALAAAGDVDEPCAAADDASRLNGLALLACSRDGPDIVVTVRGAAPAGVGALLRLMGRTDPVLDVSARAGPP